MGQHVGEHAGNMVVLDFVEDLLVAAGAADEARGAEEPEVVADQGLAGARGLGDIAHGDGTVEAGKDHLEARGVAEEPIGLGDDGEVLVVGQGHEARPGWLVANS